MAKKQIKVQFLIPIEEYKQLKQSNITGNTNDALAIKLRTLITKYTEANE